MMHTQDSVWLITGCSTGFGRELARAVVARGFRAIVTARDPASVEDLRKGHEDRVLTLSLDVTNKAQVLAAVKAGLERFGAIDVLVNNAGYGYLSAIENGDDAKVRSMFETNVFGLIDLTKAVLPSMRARRNGHIVNFSSLGGFMGFPSVGFYNATKFAVEGLSESLALECGPLGIRVTIVEPSGFRTDFAGRSLDFPVAAEGDYAATVGPQQRYIVDGAGTQAGDPVRGAAAVIAAVESADPPLRLLLGADAYTFASAKLDTLRANFEAWKDVSIGADYPAEAPAKG